MSFYMTDAAFFKDALKYWYICVDIKTVSNINNAFYLPFAAWKIWLLQTFYVVFAIEFSNLILYLNCFYMSVYVVVSFLNMWLSFLYYLSLLQISSWCFNIIYYKHIQFG